MTDWYQQGYEPPPVHQPRPRRSWAQRLLLAFSVALTLSLLAAAATLAWGLARYRDINFLEVPGVEAAPPDQPANWLLVGSDSREGIDPNAPGAGVFVGSEVAGKRTDTIIVARVDPASQRIDLLSVPRDLWVPISGTGANGRINSAFNGDGGEQRLVATVEDALGIEINHYAEVNFVGFQDVIDTLGGVPIWFDTPVRDLNSGLDVPTPGCHTLDGFQALAFARSRFLEFQDADGTWRSDPTGDLGRTARQQYLLSRLADTAAARLDVTEVRTVDRLLQSGGRNLVLDDGVGPLDLVGLARVFAQVGSDGFHRHSLPVSGFRTSGGASVLALDEAGAQSTLDFFRPSVPAPEAVETVARRDVVVDVLNGARVTGIAGVTADELLAAGFTVGEIGNAESVPSTVIRYPTAQRDAAGTLAAVLPVPVVFEADDSLVTVTLVVGPEFPGLNPAPATADDPAAPATPAEQVAAPAAGEAPPPQPAPDNEVGVVPGPAPEGTPCA